MGKELGYFLVATLVCSFVMVGTACALDSPPSTPAPSADGPRATSPSEQAPTQPVPAITTPSKPVSQPSQELASVPQGSDSSKAMEADESSDIVDTDNSLDIMNSLKADVTAVHTTLLALTAEKMHLVQKGDKWVHIFHTGVGGPNSSFEVEADNLLSAIEHIEKAYSLVESKKLPTRTANNGSEKEILLEVGMTLRLLKQQVSYTVQLEKEAINWVEGYKNPDPRISGEYIDKEARIRSIHELFDSYRGKLVQPIDELVYIMSYGQPYLQAEEQ